MASASDFTRFKRLSRDRTYATTIASNLDVIPPTRFVPDISTNTPKYHGVGTTKYRRPASYWTSYLAAQTGTFGLEKKVTKVCDCTTLPYPHA